MGTFIDEIIGDASLRAVYVDEWDRTIYVRPFSLADSDYASRMSKGKDGEYIAYMLIRKCLNEDGNKLFDVGDKMKLMTNFDADMLSTILLKLKGESVEVEDAVKN